ncbi:hypothetical protein J437_LFUL011726, partial [Ladona fulva]
MENRSASILDIAIEINNKNIKESGTAAQSGDRALLILGSKGAGKSTLINSLQGKNELPKPTLALEYSFLRRSGKSLVYKDVCNIWELGGGLLFSDIASVPIKYSGSLNKIAVILMLDLSNPQQLWITLEHYLMKLIKILSEYADKHGLSEEVTKNSWERLSGMHHHQDKSFIEPFPIPLLIIGGKYDVFKQFDIEDKKLICQTLRNISHSYGATLVFYSSKDQVLLKRGKDLLTQYAFYTSISNVNKNIVQDFLKPLFIPAGADSFQQIGVSPSGSLQEESVFTVPEDPAKDKHFEEPGLDLLISQKNN